MLPRGGCVSKGRALHINSSVNRDALLCARSSFYNASVVGEEAAEFRAREVLWRALSAVVLSAAIAACSTEKSRAPVSVQSTQSQAGTQSAVQEMGVASW